MINVEVDHRTSASWAPGELFHYVGHGVPLRKRHLFGDPTVVFLTVNADFSAWVATSGIAYASHRREFVKQTSQGPMSAWTMEVATGLGFTVCGLL